MFALKPSFLLFQLEIPQPSMHLSSPVFVSSQQSLYVHVYFIAISVYLVIDACFEINDTYNHSASIQ